MCNFQPSKSEGSPETLTDKVLGTGQTIHGPPSFYIFTGVPVCKRPLLCALQRHQTSEGPQYRLNLDDQKCPR